MSSFLTQKELPESEQPYEKCEAYGPGVLSDAELLAVIIKSGVKGERAVDLAIRILKRPGQKTGLSCLYEYSQKELMQKKGIGRVKAIQLICVAELAKRMQYTTLKNTVPFTSPKQISETYMGKMSHNKTEEILLLLLDIKNRKISDSVISKGTVSTSLLEPREVYSYALQNNAFSIVVLHNHPSGDPTPSQADLLITKRLVTAGEIVGIPLKDHIIIGNHNYISLREFGAID